MQSRVNSLRTRRVNAYKKDCQWNPNCTHASQRLPAAWEAAKKVQQGLVGGGGSLYWVDHEGTWDFLPSWVSKNCSGVISYWNTMNPTLWQLSRLAYTNWHTATATAAALEFNNSGKFSIDYGCFGGTAHSTSFDSIRDMQSRAPDLYGALPEDKRLLLRSMGWCMGGLINEALHNSNHLGQSARLVPTQHGTAAAPICEWQLQTLKGKEAESYSIIGTPGAEASGALGVSLDALIFAFGVDMEVVLFEGAAPVEFRGMRTKDNKSAELAIWQTLTIDILKVKFKVWISTIFSPNFEVTLIDTSAANGGKGVLHWKFDLWGPFKNSFGCSGANGSCGYEPND